MRVIRGKKHDYLGMNLDCTKPGKVKVDMIDCTVKMAEDFPCQKELGTNKMQTPAAKHSFQTRDTTEISKEKAEVFHTWVAKGLFLCQRSRSDIQTAIAFSCTRVKNPDEDDWKKLIRLICHLKSTKHLFLTLEANNLKDATWWADAAFAVHPDMKSVSRKQKLNTKSSAQAELV